MRRHCYPGQITWPVGAVWGNQLLLSSLHRVLRHWPRTGQREREREFSSDKLTCCKPLIEFYIELNVTLIASARVAIIYCIYLYFAKMLLEYLSVSRAGMGRAQQVSQGRPGPGSRGWPLS